MPTQSQVHSRRQGRSLDEVDDAFESYTNNMASKGEVMCRLGISS